jgi:hypothetical protein
MQQRLRVGIDVLMRDLSMAGAGVSTGRSRGPLVDYFAPIMPYRVGDASNDPSSGVFYRPDTITIVYVPATVAQTTISQPIAASAQTLLINRQDNCPAAGANQSCGFTDKTRAVLFDSAGAWNAMTVTAADNWALQVRYGGVLNAAYDAGSVIAEAVTRTYYLKTDVAAGAFELMRYDGAQTVSPVLDNVVKLEFRYFGDPQPPAVIPGKAMEDPVGPFTTYGPRPPRASVDDERDAWPAGENCIFSVQDAQHVPRLPVLAAGTGDVELPSALLTDGPWCVDADRVNRFDADLLRVRRVRVGVRVQAAAASLRGPAGILFTRGGTGSAGYVPDREITFDVAPRNLNLAR